ncbi:MoaD/ThiS family protein [Oleiagrimonas sp.]|jgi:molybdopterin synthase sulfur carrier subunit|uniref:MoaD/ThiS family protein n=1 Tax=Oleiagrimonas sp. TaxID=2010330 RepID=UPI00261AFA2E|nr:MoaD/ThiS family protein [Oleiagrimonas sp.]MDA3914989.1 MoaD/ThiS family protein [Oleiagrimonas sp.]
MKVHIELFGALREADDSGAIELDVPAQATIAMLREALQVYLAEHAPNIRAGLVQRSAFASDQAILQNDHTVPDSGRLAVLPPVSGG